MNTNALGTRHLALASIISLLAMGVPGKAAAINFQCQGVGGGGEFTVGTFCQSGELDFFVDEPAGVPDISGTLFGKVDVTLEGLFEFNGSTVVQYGYRLTEVHYAVSEFQVDFDVPLSADELQMNPSYIPLDAGDPDKANEVPPDPTQVRFLTAEFPFEESPGVPGCGVFGKPPCPEGVVGYEAEFDGLVAGGTTGWMVFQSTTLPIEATGEVTGTTMDLQLELIGRMALAGPGGVQGSALMCDNGNCSIGVPEPATLVLVGTGLVGVGVWRRSRRRNRAA